MLFSRNAQAIISDKILTVTTGQTRGERNNNPGNIRNNSKYKWQGQIGVDSAGYIIFDNVINGIRAIAKDLLSKNTRGLDSVFGIISVYAPPSENDTSAYIATVSKALNVSAFDSLDLTDFDTLYLFVLAIIKHENGRINYADQDLILGVNAALHG